MEQKTLLLDCRGLNCPLPVLHIQKKIKTLKSGFEFKVYTTDPGSLNDIPAWADFTNNKVLLINEKEDFYEFLLRKE